MADWSQNGGVAGPDAAYSHYEMVEDGDDAVITFEAAKPMYRSALIEHFLLPYNISKPPGGWRSEFTAEEKVKLRPIAETLAMLDGNAFFGSEFDGHEWFEQYLPEAHALWEANGGDSGGAGASSMGPARA